MYHNSESKIAQKLSLMWISLRNIFHNLSVCSKTIPNMFWDIEIKCRNNKSHIKAELTDENIESFEKTNEILYF